MSQITRTVNGRTLTCKDFTPYTLYSSVKTAAQKVCEELGLEEAIFYTCETCNQYHILDETPNFLKGH